MKLPNTFDDQTRTETLHLRASTNPNEPAWSLKYSIVVLYFLQFQHGPLELVE
jgi:hypothetical protein